MIFELTFIHDIFLFIEKSDICNFADDSAILLTTKQCHLVEILSNFKESIA